MVDMGYWPPQQGLGLKASNDPGLSAPLSATFRRSLTATTLHGGAPRTWDEVIEKGKAGVAGGKIKYRSCSPVCRATDCNLPAPLLLSFEGFRRQVNIIFNSRWQASADYLSPH
jgi:multiple sugar transport system substrate-binding protein